MDFKDNNIMLVQWPSDALDRLTSIFPYQFIWEGRMYSLPALDFSSHFMLHIGRLNQDELTSYGYAVEVPLSSKIRLDFERGKINWSEFWGHKGWIIEFSLVLYSDDPVKARYIELRDANPTFLKTLHDLDALGSPYKIYHDQLVDNCEFEKTHRPFETECRDEYEEFVLRYRDFIEHTCTIHRQLFCGEDKPIVKKVA